MLYFKQPQKLVSTQHAFIFLVYMYIYIYTRKKSIDLLERHKYYILWQ